MEGVAMSISEFVACDADYDAALRFAGSLPDGTDVEHTPVACWPDVDNRRIAALEGEVAELRRLWASVPWEVLHHSLLCIEYVNAGGEWYVNGEAEDALRAWLAAHAPKEANHD